MIFFDSDILKYDKIKHPKMSTKIFYFRVIFTLTHSLLMFQTTYRGENHTFGGEVHPFILFLVAIELALFSLSYKINLVLFGMDLALYQGKNKEERRKEKSWTSEQ